MWSEISNRLGTGAKPTLDRQAAVKQLVFDDDQWVSYDDEETFKMKMEYADTKCLGGAMVWAVSTDNSKLEMSKSLGTSMDRNTLSVLWKAPEVPPATITQCIWGDCDEECPDGTGPASNS